MKKIIILLSLLFLFGCNAINKTIEDFIELGEKDTSEETWKKFQNERQEEQNNLIKDALFIYRYFGDHTTHRTKLTRSDWNNFELTINYYDHEYHENNIKTFNKADIVFFMESTNVELNDFGRILNETYHTCLEHYYNDENNF